MEISEMCLGQFGLTERDVMRLKHIFKTVEYLIFPFRKEYDLYYIDISYASRRVIESIRILTFCWMPTETIVIMN